MKKKALKKLPPQEYVAQLVRELEIEDFFDWFKKHPQSYIAFLRASPPQQRTYLQACGLLKTAAISEKTGFTGYSQDWSFDQWVEFISFWPKLSIFRSSAPSVCVDAFAHLPEPFRLSLRMHFGETTFTSNLIAGMSDDEAYTFITSNFPRFRDIRVKHGQATRRELERYPRVSLKVKLLTHYLEIERQLVSGSQTGTMNKLNSALALAKEKERKVISLKGKLPEAVKNAILYGSVEQRSAERTELVSWGNDRFKNIFLNLVNGRFDKGEDKTLWFMEKNEIREFIDLIGITQVDLTTLRGLREVLKAKFLLSYPSGTPDQLQNNLVLLDTRKDRPFVAGRKKQSA